MAKRKADSATVELTKRIDEIEESIKKIEREIEKKDREIEKIEEKISNVTNQKDKERLLVEKNHLREEKKQLREEKKQLRDKENHLRDEKKYLRDDQGPTSKKQKVESSTCHRLEEFYAGLRVAEITEDFLTLRNEATFLGNAHLPSRLFIREAYKDLHGLINSSDHSVLVLGNPGIGKSFFSYYELYQFIQKLKDNETIVYESLPYDVFMVLDARRVISAGPRDKYNIFQGPIPSYYLFDAGTKSPTRPYLLGCKTIVFSSPNKANYHDFLKHENPNRFYMPVWSKDELLKVASSFDNDPDDCHTFDERYDIFGGIPRYVFANRSDELKGAIRSTLTGCDVTTLPAFLGLQDCGDYSHKIFQLDPTTNYRSAKLRFASPFVARTYYEVLEESVNLSPCKFLLTCIGKPFVSAARGQIFEVWAHKKLCRGGRFRIKELLDSGVGQESEIKLKEMQHVSFTNLTDLAEKYSPSADLYFEPSNVTFEAVDSVSNNIGFQMTVAPQHPVCMKGLANVMKVVKSRSFKLYFVVPDDVYENPNAFTEMQTYLTTKGKVAVDLNSMEGVTQYILCLPLERAMGSK